MDDFKAALYPAVAVVALIVVACQPTAVMTPSLPATPTITKPFSAPAALAQPDAKAIQPAPDNATDSVPNLHDHIARADVPAAAPSKQ